MNLLKIQLKKLNREDKLFDYKDNINKTIINNSDSIVDFQINFIELIGKYKYGKNKPTEKVQEIIKNQYNNYFEELFDDIRNIFIIDATIAPEEVYLFISKIIEGLYNDKNNMEQSRKYLSKLVMFLYDIPNFYEEFEKIM